MADMLNQCQFIGHLGKAPEIRSLSNGDKVANFSIAVSEKWTDKNTGEKRERTTWVPIVVYGGLVNICEKYLHKGSRVFVQGKFSVRKWQDQNGADRYSTEIVLQGFNANLTMLDGKSEGASAPQEREPDDYSDEVPF